MSRTSDALVRVALRVAASLATTVCFFVRPTVRGAVVLVRHEGRLLLLRFSYRRWLGLPGGRLGRGEEARAGALRELREETGLAPPPEALALVDERVVHHSYIEDHVCFFEWRPEEAPVPEVDRREVVAAEWFPEEALAELPLWPPLAEWVAEQRR